MAGATLHATHADIVKRLRRAMGQLETIVTMIEGARPCAEVAMQLHAAERAIAHAKKAFVHDHIDHCLENGVSGATGSRQVIREFKEISKYL